MTDLKAAVFTVLEGWALPLDARKILETAYYAQPEQEPVSYSGNGTAGVQNETKPTGFFFQIPPKQESFDRLLRIMCTFDLATGHADNLNDLLDSLESELRDVLGHYREALKAQPEQEPVCDKDPFYCLSIRCQVGKVCKHTAQPEQKPVAWISDSPTKGNGKQLHFTKADAWKWSSNITPLYAVPPRKGWVGLTDEEINDFDKKLRDNGDYCSLHFAWGISAKLKEKNT